MKSRKQESAGKQGKLWNIAQNDFNYLNQNKKENVGITCKCHNHRLQTSLTYCTMKMRH